VLLPPHVCVAAMADGAPQERLVGWRVSHSDIYHALIVYDDVVDDNNSESRR